ncbi:MAG TPA: hypothetical protein VFE32_21235 [Puia sp.]|nr:hypothetical protein [Puia sp.]
MRLHFLLLLLLPVLSACSNASGTHPASSSTHSGSPSTATQPDPPSTATQSVSSSSATRPDSSSLVPDRPRETPAELNLRLALESTLSSKQPGITIPPFGLDKVMAAIRQMHETDTESDEGFTIALSDSVYNALTFKEKFTYNLIHGESYQQMCDPLPERPHEEARIYGQTVDYFGEFRWSDRQENFFKNNRDSVEQLMKAVIAQPAPVGMNLLDAIIVSNATGLIPNLIDAGRRDNSNHYILTTLMVLMKKNNYPEFTASTSYMKLYTGDADTYSRYLIYNKANEDLIIRRATNFYKTLSR